MDFILPEYSLKNLRTAMENGTFFSVARYAKNELGEDFVGHGPWPKVTELHIDNDAQTISVKGVNASVIEWISDGEIIKTDVIDADGEIESVINLSEFESSISCYVRAQLKGKGGICLTQPFICDDGDLQRFKKPIPEKKHLTKKEQRKKDFFDTRLGVIIDRSIINK